MTGSLAGGVEGYAELGARLDETWSLFGRGFVRPDDAGGMLGVRARW